MKSPYNSIGLDAVWIYYLLTVKFDLSGCININFAAHIHLTDLTDFSYSRNQLNNYLSISKP